MFLFIPLRTEDDSEQLPNWTIALIALNLIIFIFTSAVVNRQYREISELNRTLFEISDPYLTEQIQSDQSLVNLPPESIHERVLTEGWIPSGSADFQRWLPIYDEYQKKQRETIYQKWGFIPAKPNFIKMITSMFIHGGWEHVIGNMLFLWIVGCNIELGWGWKKFLSAYFISGIVACLFHAFYSAGSLIPLVGASGAIAGIMGAFLIQHFNTRIRFFYLLWFFLRARLGTLRLKAGYVLPFWFLQEFFMASVNARTGTAHMAHVSGFVMGGLVALSLRYFDARDDENFAAKHVDENGETIVRELTPISDILPATTANADTLQKIIDREPYNFAATWRLAQMNMQFGYRDEAIAGYNQTLETLLEYQDYESILNLYQELRDRQVLGGLTPLHVFGMASLFEKKGRYKTAVSLYSRYVKRFPEGELRPRAIYKTALLLKHKLENESLARSAVVMLRREYPDFTPQTG